MSKTLLKRYSDSFSLDLELKYNKKRIKFYIVSDIFGIKVLYKSENGSETGSKCDKILPVNLNPISYNNRDILMSNKKVGIIFSLIFIYTIRCYNQYLQRAAFPLVEAFTKKVLRCFRFIF